MYHAVDPQPLPSTSSHVAQQDSSPLAAPRGKSDQHQRARLSVLLFVWSAMLYFAANAVAAPNRLLTVSPASIDFGNLNVGGGSTQTVILSNTGNGGVTISQANVTGPGFSISGLSLPFTLGPRQSTSFSAVFAPAAGGSATGRISVLSNATNSPATVSLSGFGLTFLLSASPASIDFGNVSVGSSGTQAMILTNTGNRSVTISQANVAGSGFSISGPTLPLTLNSGQTTSFSAVFAPGAGGSATGNISVVSNATNSPASVSLSGFGLTSLLSASPTSTAFGNIQISSSSVLPVILTNAGTGSVTLSQATVTGTGFSISDLSLPLTLAAGQSTNFSVTFAPMAAGSVTGNVSIVSDTTNSPTNEPLSGTGIHAVNLSWDASSSQVAGYNVYRGSASGGPYSEQNSSLVTQTAYADTTVQAGQTYYYVTTAVDSGGNQSSYSNEVQAIVPSS